MLLLVIATVGLLLQSITGVRGDEVRLTKLEVPQYVKRGDEVRLRCEWDLGLHRLYSVTWYRNDREFYNFIPSQIPSRTTHPLPGITVNEEMSDGETVVLSNVDLETSGRYKCEVIADQPVFYTADKSATMVVAAVPDEKPTIHGTKHKYHIGDTAKLTCVSAKSLPPTDLTWFINDKEAAREYLMPMPSSRDPSGLEQTRLRLQFLVSREHFRHGEMTLRCSAKIPSLYYKTQQHSVDGQPTYNVPVMESRDIWAFSGGASIVQPQMMTMKMMMTMMMIMMIPQVAMAIVEEVLEHMTR